ncbi:hypothetical protein HZA42_04090 [Candidatus Peregrinibacteria bacterium]|nr:hypothetical protein [Candidatus Peregrinibacteria bacterium]
MRNLPESTSGHQVKSRGAMTSLGRNLTARFAAAVLAATAASACGGLDFDGHDRQPGQPDACEKKPTPPQATVLDHTLEGNRLRVNFTVPEFDGTCLLPVRVSILATTARVPGSRSGNEAELESATIVTTGGKTFADVMIPASIGSIPSFQLVLTGENGERSYSQPVSMM